MPMTDPMKRDEDAGHADLLAVYQKYGRTDAIARQRGGEAFATARREEIERIDDVYSQCQLLEQTLPEWTGQTPFRLTYPRRPVS
jgi:hypothetical protein